MDFCCIGEYMGNSITNAFDVICCSYGLTDTQKDDVPKFMRRDGYKLFYVFSGELAVEIDGMPYLVKQYCSFMVYPFSTLVISAKSRAKYYEVDFGGIEATAMVSRTAFSRSQPIVGEIEPEEVSAFFEFIAQNRQPTPYAQYRRGGVLIALLSYYIEYFPGQKAETEKYVIGAIQFIEENFAQPDLSVIDVAAHLKINRTYLYRLFKNEMGCSVVDYITRRRIYQAEIALANKDQSVKDIAHSCGYSDQLYFSRVFKRVKGKTPTEFRQMFSK